MTEFLKLRKCYPRPLQPEDRSTGGSMIQWWRTQGSEPDGPVCKLFLHSSQVLYETLGKSLHSATPLSASVERVCWACWGCQATRNVGLGVLAIITPQQENEARPEHSRADRVQSIPDSMVWCPGSSHTWNPILGFRCMAAMWVTGFPFQHKIFSWFSDFSMVGSRGGKLTIHFP